MTSEKTHPLRMPVFPTFLAPPKNAELDDDDDDEDEDDDDDDYDMI